MASKQFKNFAQHKLTVAALSTDVTLTWDSVAGWPTTGDWPLRLDDPSLAVSEIVLVTAVNVGALQTTVTRHQEGTAAAAFPINSTGGNEFTAQAISDALARIDAPYGAPASVGSRFLGQWATSGPPASGTWLLNDYGFDNNPYLWICTVAGTPGTWRPIGPSPYKVRAHQSVAQSIPNNAWTSTTNMSVATADDYDPNTNFAANTYTVPVTGKYDVRIRGGFTGAGAAGTRIGVRVLKNGATIPLAEVSQPISAGVQTAGATTSDILTLTATDTLVLQLYQDSGGALNSDIAPVGGSGTNAGVVLTVNYVGP